MSEIAITRRHSTRIRLASSIKRLEEDDTPPSSSRQTKTMKKRQTNDDSHRRAVKPKTTQRQRRQQQTITTTNDIPGTNLNKPLLLEIGPLYRGILLRRPSSQVKSPYVADVQLLDPNDDNNNNKENGSIIRAWAPALDVGGLCVPDSIVYLSKRSVETKGTTTHSIELVQTKGPMNEMVLVGVHPQLGEKLTESVLNQGLLSDEIMMDGITSTKNDKQPFEEQDESNSSSQPSPTTNLRRQCTYNDSRIDFELTTPTKTYLMEVKNVVCADYHPLNAPTTIRNPNHCVITVPDTIPPSQYARTALFPWGIKRQTFESQKVVSSRAIKHIRNLMTFSQNDDCDPIAVLVVNRSDCEAVRACHEACPVFASELKRAKDEFGVKVLAFRVLWCEDGKAYFDGVVPVMF